MQTWAFSIYDHAAACYGVPFFQPTKGVAIRMFTDGANDPNSYINKHPSDYTLYQIGEFDDSIGALIQTEAPTPIINAQELVEVTAPPLSRFNAGGESNLEKEAVDDRA